MQNATSTLFVHVGDDGFREQKRRRHIHGHHPLPESHFRIRHDPVAKPPTKLISTSRRP